MELFFDIHTVCSLLQDYGAVQHLHNCAGRFIEYDRLMGLASRPELPPLARHITSIHGRQECSNN